MNWLRKPVILFLLIINLSVPLAISQNLTEIVQFSDQHFTNGNYELAANEYNRALFFGHPDQDQLCLKIANCYFNQNKYEQSIQFFDRAYFSSASDSIKTEAILGKSFSLIMGKKYMLALSELINIDSAKIVSQDIKLNLLKGIAYFGLYNDDLSENAFNKCIRRLSDQNELSTIEKEFDAIKKSEKRYNPQTAWFMSLILPGSGQFYSGEFKEGANSVILLGGLLFLTIHLAKKTSYLVSLITILPWFQRYYMGGANKAERFALEKQKIKRNESYQSVLKCIEIGYQNRSNITN